MALTKIDDRGLTTPIDLLDSEKIRFGTGNDLEIYTDGSHSWISHNGDGNLRIYSGGAESIRCTEAGATSLFHNGTEMFYTHNAGIKVNDNKKFYLGTSSDLQIYHDGSDSYIKHSGAGNFYVQTSEASVEDLFLQAGNDVYIRVQTGETAIKAIGDGAVELYWDGNKKFETLSTGVSISGNLDADQIDVGDAQEIRLGASADLKVVHDGSNSYVNHNGTGDFYVQAQGADENLWLRAKDDVNIQTNDNENSARFLKNGAVELYHDNNKKLHTTNIGSTITGSLTINNSNYDALIVTNNDDGSNGPYITLINDSSSPSNSDQAGVISFRGKDSSGDTTTYGQIRVYTTDINQGQESGEMTLSVRNSNSFEEKVRIESDGDFRLSGGDAATNYGWIRGWQDATGDMIIGADQSATGTGTSKSNLIFRSRGSEKMRVDSSGRLLIGHDETTDVGGIEAALQVTGTTSDNSSLTLSRFSVDDWCSFLTFSKSRNGTKGNQTACTSNERLGQIFWTGSDGTDTANGCAEITAKADGNFSSNNCPTKLEFGVNAGGTSSTTYLTIKPNGNVEVNDGNLVVANTHGIDFSATSGSGDSELFSDYEEGTWTAGLVTGTATHDKTKYRKIGSVVHLWGRLYSPSDTTSTNQVIVTGLPFAVSDGTAVGSCFGKDIDNKETLTTFVNTSEQMYFYGLQNSNAWNSMKHADFGASVELYYHVTYHTT